MRWIGAIITKRPVVTAIFFLILTVVMVAGAAKMKVATGNDTLMSVDSKVYQDNRELEQHFGGESIILLTTSQQDKGILTVPNLRRMKELGDSLKQYDEVYSFTSPAEIVEQMTAKQSGKMLGNLSGIQKGLYSDIMQPGLPGDPATLNTLLYDQGKLRPVFNELILDDKHSIMMIKLKGDTDDGTKEKIIDTIKRQLERDPFNDAETIVAGNPVMDSAVRANMQISMKKMIGIAVVLMLIVLTVVFHVRWRVLAIPIILMSVAATLGLMGHLKVPMTMVSMAVFPILIGLGVDYAIQFQNRYEEERNKEGTADV